MLLHEMRNKVFKSSASHLKCICNVRVHHQHMMSLHDIFIPIIFLSITITCKLVTIYLRGRKFVFLYRIVTNTIAFMRSTQTQYSLYKIYI